jgi:hypothetical protein
MHIDDDLFNLWFDTIGSFLGTTNPEFSKDSSKFDYAANWQNDLTDEDKMYLQGLPWEMTIEQPPTYSLDYIEDSRAAKHLFGAGLEFFSQYIPRVHILIKPWQSDVGNLFSALLMAQGMRNIHLVLDFSSSHHSRMDGKPTYPIENNGQPHGAIRGLCDPLGAFFYYPQNPRGPSARDLLPTRKGQEYPDGYFLLAERDYPRVVIYMKRILDASHNIRVRPESLFTVVLYHELAHAMHLTGCPLHTRTDQPYNAGTSALIEWVAQSLTWKACQNDGDLLDTFMTLDRNQPAIYRTWRYQPYFYGDLVKAFILFLGANTAPSMRAIRHLIGKKSPPLEDFVSKNR